MAESMNPSNGGVSSVFAKQNLSIHDSDSYHSPSKGSKSIVAPYVPPKEFKTMPEGHDDAHPRVLTRCCTLNFVSVCSQSTCKLQLHVSEGLWFFSCCLLVHCLEHVFGERQKCAGVGVPLQVVYPSIARKV